ncbi:hypothetical protein [Streptomyces sp. NPDC005538]|uniref:hypothetical protein n=1 Tax=unclassified Streptomyces TaxID=2593676 RepID=UPI0033BB7673
MTGTLLRVALHVLLIGSMLTFVACSIAVIFKTADPMERVIRVGAVFSGALVVLGAQAAGLDFADFTVTALAQSGPGAHTAVAAGAVIPGGAGVGLGYVLRRLATRPAATNQLAVRVMAFVGMLAATEFAMIYTTALSRDGADIGAAAVPNCTFVVGIILTIVFTYDPTKSTRGGAANNGKRLRDGIKAGVRWNVSVHGGREYQNNRNSDNSGEDSGNPEPEASGGLQ